MVGAMCEPRGRAALARFRARAHLCAKSAGRRGRVGARMSLGPADLGVVAVLALVLCALLPNVLAVQRRSRKRSADLH